MDGQERKEGAVTKRLTSKRTPVTCKEPVHVTSGSSLEVTLNISLPAGCYLTQGVTSDWQVMVFRQEEGKVGRFVVLFSFTKYFFSCQALLFLVTNTFLSQYGQLCKSSQNKFSMIFIMSRNVEPPVFEPRVNGRLTKIRRNIGHRNKNSRE